MSAPPITEIGNVVSIPIAGRQSRSVGLKVMPKKDYEVNVLMEAAKPEVGACE